MALGDAFNFFVSRGWSPVQSAGIVGNLFGESGLDPRAVGDGGRAFGLAQWHPDRQGNFARVFGMPIQQASFSQQLQFVDWELRNTESRAGNLLRGADTIPEATQIFGQYYERPANLGASIGRRTDAAIQAARRGIGNGRDALRNLLGDTAGNIVSDGLGYVGNSLENASRDAEQFVENIIPGSEFVFDIGHSIFGGGGESDCMLNPFCYLRRWMEQSSFFSRLILAILAFILIAAGIFMLKGDDISKALPVGRITKG